jgi:hypothetical protein
MKRFASPLNNWLSNNFCFMKKGDRRHVTHLLLNGGRLHIVPTLIPEFQKRYAIDLKNNFKHYIIEIKTDVFKLFCDLDFLDTRPMTKEDILPYAITIQSVVNGFYTNVDIKQIICTTEPKKVNYHGIEYVKTGVHLIWPNINTDQKNALIIREAFIQKLLENHSERPYYNTWSNVVDETVYRENGLRMIGSRKMSKCGNCSKSKQEDSEPEEYCPNNCDANGKIDEGRVYLPTQVISGISDINEEYLQKLLDNYVFMVKETSIAIQEHITDSGELARPSPHSFKTPFPLWFKPVDVSKLLSKRRVTMKKNKENKNPPSAEELNTMSKLNLKKQIDQDDTAFKKLNTFCKKNLPKCYQKSNILSLNLCGDKISDYYVATVDTNFCMNIGREHRSNRIYYYINPSGVYQKCFCTCDTTHGRISGKKCSEYRSAGRPLSTQLKYLLFPKEKQKNNDFIIPTNEMYARMRETGPTLKEMDVFLDQLYGRLTDQREYEDMTYSS